MRIKEPILYIHIYLYRTNWVNGVLWQRYCLYDCRNKHINPFTFTVWEKNFTVRRLEPSGTYTTTHPFKHLPDLNTYTFFPSLLDIQCSYQTKLQSTFTYIKIYGTGTFQPPLQATGKYGRLLSCYDLHKQTTNHSQISTDACAMSADNQTVMK